MMAMTAHEAALYDNQAGGSLRKTMTSLTHKNLPLAMFLEYADMGFPAYTGATNKTCSNDTIITYLGMGIVWFTDPPAQPEPTDYDYEYRVDTDVITPVTLYAGSEINPDSPATVSFSINGSTYRMNNIVIPSGDSQIAWVKWHTPSEPQDITIYVSTNKGSLSQSTIRAKVVDLSGNDPPDPKATDTMGSWSASSIPSRETKTYAAWSVWWAKWHPYWVWHSTGKNTGYWVDDGWYAYRLMLKDYPDVMDIGQMCEALGVSTKTGYKLLKDGKIEYLKIGRAYRIPKAHILRYLKITCSTFAE